MKLTIDTMNIWFSPGCKKWNVCALVRRSKKDPLLLKRHKRSFKTFKAAMNYADKTFVGVK